MTFGPQTPFLDPDNFLFGMHYPGEAKNQSHVDDPIVTDMLIRQRHIFDVAKRREVIHDLQRYLARQQYYVQLPSGTYVAVGAGALQDDGGNRGYEYGGRLLRRWHARGADSLTQRASGR